MKSKQSLKRKKNEDQNDFSGKNPTQFMPAVPVIQKAAPEEELQMKTDVLQKAAPEEELQMKSDVLQKAAPEEELQMKADVLQKAAPEEELQMKADVLQKAAPEEELQMKSDVLQKAAAEEELQMKADVLQKAAPEEELQMKTDVLQKAAPEEELQMKTEVLQKEEDEERRDQKINGKPNNTGLPDHLKAGVEHLSGIPLDDVKVHYNSPEPKAVKALAFAQGKNIHVAPGQEKHLAHEAWHVAQQQQGRVEATKQMKDGIKVNDDAGLENEADVMGAKALKRS